MHICELYHISSLLDTISYFQGAQNDRKLTMSLKLACMHVYTGSLLHDLNEWIHICYVTVIPSKYLGPWGFIPLEKVPILLRQCCRTTLFIDILEVTWEERYKEVWKWIWYYRPSLIWIEETINSYLKQYTLNGTLRNIDENYY